MSHPEDETRAAELIERLLVDAALRARFRQDPSGVCAQFGLELEEGLGDVEKVLQTLEIRESRSSLAGALMAAASEGMSALGAMEHAQGASPSVTGTPAGGGSAAVEQTGDQLDFGAAHQIGDVHYGFVRDSHSLGSQDYSKLLSSGYNGVLFHADDPDLAQAIEAARSAGIPDVGIWAPANGQDPTTFANRLAELSQYKPSIVVPDVEVEGKGAPGSPQWEWSETFASLYRKLVPNQTWAVTVMPLQDDFNYGAYTGRGAGVWPQAYGATYATTFDPQEVVKRVVANGVDPRFVNPVLAPNQPGTGLRHYASYALDDFGGQYPAFTPGPGTPEPTGGGGPPVAAPSPPEPANPQPPAAPSDSRSPHPSGEPKPGPSSTGEPSPDPEPGPAEAVGVPEPVSAGEPRDSGVFDVLFPHEPKRGTDAGNTEQLGAAVHPDAGGVVEGALPDVGDVYPGDTASREQLAAWMARQAHKAGLPGELPVMAALVESGLKNLSGGDRDSVGFFQMRLGVWNQGEYAGYPEHAGLQLRWFIDHALEVRRERVAAGDLSFGKDDGSWGSWIADVERPAAEYRGRYQLRLDEARELLTRGSSGGSPPVGDSFASAGMEAGGATAALAVAERYLGTPYRWGGETPDTGFDCSGIAQYAYGQVGIDLPRVAEDQFHVGVPVGRDALVPGDLVFFQDSHGYIHHEGIYVGGGEFLHAPHTGDVVKISSLDEPYYARQFAGGRRVAEMVQHGDRPESDLASEGTQSSASESGIFSALGPAKEQSPSPRSTVQFLPAVPEPGSEPGEDLPQEGPTDHA
jgi:hypothetical protein